MIQFGNLLYFELAAFLSLFFLLLNLFTMKRIGYFKKRDIARSLMWSGIVLFLGLAASTAKLNWEISVPVKEKAKIIFALDASLSALARDVEVTEKNEKTRKITRFDFEKQLVENVVIDLLEGDAVGVTFFADQAIPVQDVLSREDYRNSIIRNLKYYDDVFVKEGIKQGTDYGILIMSGMEQFGGKDEIKKLLFVLTDGEPQGDEEKLKENLKKALELFSERSDIVMYFFCIGDTRGPSKIPKEEDEKGNPKEYYLQKDGQPVLTRPNPEFLTNLANATGGHFVQAESSQDLKNILLNSIEQERRIIGWEQKTEPIDLTPYLLISSLVFLFIIPILKPV